MNTLFPRADDAARFTTAHSPTSLGFAERPTGLERLQLRIGLWLIRRASAESQRRPKRDAWAEHQRLERFEAERDRMLAQAHFIMNRMR